MGSSCSISLGVFTSMMRKVLKQARLNKQYSQTQLAKLLGIANSTVCDWEAGRSLPSRGARRNISRTLNIPMETLNTIYYQERKERENAHKTKG